MANAMPIDFKISNLEPGKAPKVCITYQCDSREEAERQMHKAATIYAGMAIEAEWQPETGILVLVLQ